VCHRQRERRENYKVLLLLCMSLSSTKSCAGITKRTLEGLGNSSNEIDLRENPKNSNEDAEGSL
jgi:hypothetical protein